MYKAVDKCVVLCDLKKNLWFGEIVSGDGSKRLQH
jgi:hypothetical protein